MPQYDYRCQNCGRENTQFYKTYKDYDAAVPVCPYCASDALTRIIRRVTLAKPTRSYGAMSSGEMLNVLESGNSRDVGQMFHEVGGDAALSDPAFSGATERLMRGDTPDSIAADLP